MRRTWKNVIAALPVLVAVGFMAGCPEEDPTTPDGGTEECQLGETDCCVRASDCKHLTADGFVASCDKPTGACFLMCNESSDCASLQPDRCSGDACVCDEGLCVVPACSADVDCGGEGKCVGGSCEAGARADGCVIAPNPLYVHQDGTAVLRAFATLGGDYVVPQGEITWSSDNAAVATVDVDGVVTGGTAEDATTITATVDDATCTADVINFAAVSGTDVRVVVFDEVSRDPVAGATVVIEVPGGAAVTGTTEADGSITLQGIAAANIGVHVLTAADLNTTDAPNGYAYVSLVNTASKDLVVYLPRNASPDTAGGFKGSMTPEDFALLGSDSVHLAIAGASIPGNFVDLDLDLLVGELVPTHIEIGSIAQDTSLPSGVVAGLSANMFKSDYRPHSLPGERAAWMLAGNLPLEPVLALAQAAESGDINIGESMAILLPLLGGFQHAVQPGVAVGEAPRLTDGSPDYGSASAFPAVDLLPDTELSLRGLIQVPTLPQLGGQYLDGAIILGGSEVRGQGLVPLGLTAGLDILDDTVQTKNGIVNDEGEDAMAGVVPLRLAPQHGGIEGGSYLVLGMAIGFDSLGMEEGERQAISGFATIVDSISFDQQIDLGANAFLNFAENAEYTVATRTYQPSAVAGATFYRLSIDDADERTWVVYHDGTDAIELIDPADYGLGDRASGAALNADAQALVTRGLTLDGLFAFDGQDLDEMIRVLSGFSTIDAAVVAP